MRGLSFDAVFVPGLAERMFPRKIVEEPILLDALRIQRSAVVSQRTKAKTGCRCRFSSAGKFGKIGKSALGGLHGLQRIEGRHPRSGRVKIETGIGETDPALGSAGRES